MSLVEILQDHNPWWSDGAKRRAADYPIRRDLQPLLLAQVLRVEDRRAMVLVGPRQVGKTVLLFQLADDVLAAGWPPSNLTYFDFSDDRLTTPVTAREIVEAEPVGLDPRYPRVFLFDEIRSAPEWDRWLKQAVDSKVGRIVATDSAAGLLREGGLESGQGRWDQVLIEGLSFREFAKLHSLTGEAAEDVVHRLPNLHDLYVERGGFPEHATSRNPFEVRRRLRADIAERAILRDVSGNVSDVQRVLDLFVYLVQDSGAELNADARGRDLGADPRSVRDWVRRLTDTSLLCPLERLASRASAALRSKVKLYAADPGLVMSFALSPVRDPKVRARAFEAAVFRHLRELARTEDCRLGYFRQGDDLEVDFVLEMGERRVAIEVTSSSRLRPEKLARLRKAGEILGVSRPLLIHGGLVEQKVEGVQPVALPSFLMNPGSCLQEGADE
ncbi:MAG TPA: ATP-binding protein [Thermoanaerobaculia bacterium]|nr:ATP-binding protein [Thermoanaerobaculia bacterium]